ncbi:hypothetical protein [Streptomyces sp. NPDC002088]|uniref:hypothetical protein n=1 Tax=Streptomyces sp. NPDC002088 TaxID=3154665 RepID=UPI0033219271
MASWAAKRLPNGERVRRNTAYLDSLAPGGDLIAVTATRKTGGITDTPDLTAVEPLLLLTRDTAGGFTTRLDNAARYAGRDRPQPRADPSSTTPNFNTLNLGPVKNQHVASRSLRRWCGMRIPSEVRDQLALRFGALFPQQM